MDRPEQAGKELPQSLEAEVSVLGAMLLEPNVIDSVIPVLRPDSFARQSHQEIFQAIVKLHNEQTGVDLVPVMEELRRRGKLEEVGGAEYLAQLVDAVPSAANAAYYAEIVQEKAMKRGLIKACSQALANAFAGRQNARDLLDATQSELFHIAEEGMSKTVVELRDVLKTTFERIDKGRERGDTYSGLPTGFVDLDDLTSGFQNGELIVLAGRPSMGKTSLALNIIERVAIEQKKAAAIFSLEMSQEQIARNMLCCHARIDSHKLRRGMLADEDYPRLSLAVGRLSEAEIYLDDTSGLSCYEIRAKARMLRSRKKLDLLVIDYLQLMEGPNIESREQQIAQISRGLKALARELDIPVIAVSQLNRGPEAREEHRPRMSDLRESGAIEQDADVVLLLHRPSQYQWVEDRELSEEDKVTELQIAKQRNGPTGLVKLAFLRQYMRFENCTDVSNDERGGQPI